MNREERIMPKSPEFESDTAILNYIIDFGLHDDLREDAANMADDNVGDGNDIYWGREYQACIRLLVSSEIRRQKAKLAKKKS
jgi:hypothetical protein